MRTGTENQITLLLIRHGATKSNQEHRYLGKTEESLSNEGREALLEGKWLERYPKAEYLFTSPMKRCLETAEILYPKATPVMIPEWEEMDFGAFEGKNYQELSGNEQYQAWIDSNGTLPFPEGESRERFIHRCEKGFLRMIKLLKEKDIANQNQYNTVAAIVHGGTIMALLSRYYGGEYFDYQVSNGTGYVCVVKDLKHQPKVISIEKIQ